MVTALLPAAGAAPVPCRGGCGQQLTDPDSIRVRMGAGCAAKHGIWHPQNATATRPASTVQGGPSLLDLIGDPTMTNEMPARPAESAVEVQTPPAAGSDLREALTAVLTGQQRATVRTARLVRDRNRPGLPLIGPAGISDLLAIIEDLAERLHRGQPVLDAAVTLVQAADRNDQPEATVQDERDYDAAGDQLAAATRAYLAETGRG